MKRFVFTIIVLALSVLALPASAQDESVSAVSITATIRTYVLEAPRANAELVRIFEADAEENAYGRDADGEWLRIMDGWVLGEVFNTVGEVGALPDATHSFSGTAVESTFLHSGPSERWFDALSAVEKGTPLLIIGRNADSTWLQVPGGWIESSMLSTTGDVSLLPVSPSGVIITAKTRTFILAEPDISAEFVDVFDSGEEALAIGRFGDWLQINRGWVSADATLVSGDIDGLPFVGDGIPVTYEGNNFVNVRNRAEFLNVSYGRRLYTGDTDLAVGRTEDARFLFLGDGWLLTSSVKIEGDVMSLPVTDGVSSTVASNSTTRHATQTSTSSSQTVLTAATIRSLVTSHTDDVRILDIKTASNATTIEYDLKPWPFVPNESIAEEVAFKIICAIRNGQEIPHTLKLIGQGHFKSDIGRKFKSPSVEIHITARNANRLFCRGNSYTDINWRSVSATYKSYPIPQGASVDYD